MTDGARDLGRYELFEPIGRGGMAVVYLGRHVALNRRVAIKQLDVQLARDDPSFAQRFLREARTAGALSHPNIITVLDYFEHDGAPFIAMEYAERGSLRALAAELRLAQIAGVLEGVLAGLAHAARHQVVHRDLKPENLLVSGDGRIAIADFGIAKALGATLLAASLTAAGSTVGTPQYMSPEQAMDGGLGVWSDLYSVGVIAYELLVGQTPFAETDAPLAVLMRHVNDPPPNPRARRPDLDPALAEWTLRLLAKDPGGRPATPTDAWDGLEPIITRLLGPHWRRDAPLLNPPAGTAVRALSSAPFSSPPSLARFESGDQAGGAMRIAGAQVAEAGSAPFGQARQPMYETYADAPPPREMSTHELQAELAQDLASTATGREDATNYSSDASKGHGDRADGPPSEGSATVDRTGPSRSAMLTVPPTLPAGGSMTLPGPAGEPRPTTTHRWDRRRFALVAAVALLVIAVSVLVGSGSIGGAPLTSGRPTFTPAARATPARTPTPTAIPHLSAGEARDFVDRFAERFNAEDLPGLSRLLADRASYEYLGDEPHHNVRDIYRRLFKSLSVVRYRLSGVRVSTTATSATIRARYRYGDAKTKHRGRPWLFTGTVTFHLTSRDGDIRLHRVIAAPDLVGWLHRNAAGTIRGHATSGSKPRRVVARGTARFRSGAMRFWTLRFTPTARVRRGQRIRVTVHESNRPTWTANAVAPHAS